MQNMKKAQHKKTTGTKDSRGAKDNAKMDGSSDNKMTGKQNMGEGQQAQEYVRVNPDSLKHTKINFDDQFARKNLNLVMFNQFDQCSCFHLDPSKKNQAQIQSEARHKDIAWIKFREDFDVSEMSASTIAQLFSKFGDFHVFKDTRRSCILNFHQIDKDALKDNTVKGFIELMNEEVQMQEFKVECCCAYSEAPRFVAHDLLE